MCQDVEVGYMCTCEAGWGGNRCDSEEAAYVAALSTGAMLAMLTCLMVLLCKYRYIANDLPWFTMVIYINVVKHFLP